jgi:hypothetical protein
MLCLNHAIASDDNNHEHHSNDPRPRRGGALAGFDGTIDFVEVSAFGATAWVEPPWLAAHTLALSSQCMPALPQSALESGWVALSAANTAELTSIAIANTIVDFTLFMASPFSRLDARLWLIQPDRGAFSF